MVRQQSSEQDAYKPLLNVQKRTWVQNVASHRLRNTGVLYMQDTKRNAFCFIPQRAPYTHVYDITAYMLKTVIYTWAKQYSIKHAHFFFVSVSTKMSFPYLQMKAVCDLHKPLQTGAVKANLQDQNVVT